MTDRKVVLITGGAKRIGAQLVRYFHSKDFRVIVHCHKSSAEAAALAEELNSSTPDSVKMLSADLSNSDQVTLLAKQSLLCFDRLDVLINNASAFYPTALATASQSDWDQLIDSNLRCAYFLSQATAPELQRRQGAVINIIDAMVDKTLPGHSIYSIAKSGLKAMTKSLAIELAPRVRVNAVAPGAILWPGQLENDTDPDVIRTRDKILQQIPLGQLGRVEDIAKACYFLACEASYVTGETIRVDGGRAL